MFKRKYHLMIPEYAAANKNGKLAPKQRTGFLWDLVMLAIAVLLLAGSAAVLFAMGKSTLMGFGLLGAAALVAMAMQEPWQIYRTPEPTIVSYSGQIRPIPNTSVRKGGFVNVGEKRVYLSRKQLQEIYWGKSYQVFVITPQNTAVSAIELPA